MIFPKFHNMDLIEQVRKKYDPLYTKVKPHITLVFPFNSEISTEDLQEHIRSKVGAMSAFSLKLSGVSDGGQGYLFLNVIQGKTELIEIHKKLYEGLLKPYYPPFLQQYNPHITIGIMEHREQAAEAITQLKDMKEVFEDTVKEISVEIIGKEENSIIEMTIELGN